jgi:hypothetical protein
MPDLTRDSLVRCSCGRTFAVGRLVRLENTHLAQPNVSVMNPDGHEVVWTDHAPSKSKEVCGWLNLLHGTGPDAMPDGREFVRLPF